MGKGKRNRQFHFEDKQANPEKYQVKPRKNPKPLPKWVTPLVAILLVVVIVGAVVANIIINSGVIYRGRILIESESGEYDLNQQMAAFILWQNMYQSAYYEWYYTSWGMYEDTYGITETYSSAIDYAVNVATYYTTEALRDGVDSISEYFLKLVAGADAGVEAGLTLDELDQAEIDAMLEWIEYVRSGSQYTFGYSMSKFLSECIGTGVKESDIVEASRLLAMYTKYSNYQKLQLDDDATVDLVNDFIVRNPAGMYTTSYRLFTTKDKAIAESLAALKDFDSFQSKVIDLVMDDHYDTLFHDRTAGKAANTDLKTIQNKKGDELTSALSSLGMTVSTVTKGDSTLDTKLSDWLFIASRKSGDTGVVLGKDAAYLVYVKTAPTTSGSTTTVEAAWKAYSYANYESLGEGFEAQLKADLAEGESTFAESAEVIAKKVYDALKADTQTMPTDATKVNTTKPLDKNDTNTAPEAILDVIYATGLKVEVGNFYQADDFGTSYVVEILEVDGTNYKIAYKSYEDSFYYSIFRAMKDNLEDDYPAAEQTLSYPASTTEGSVNEWLAESTFIDKTADSPATRIFARQENDIKYFENTTTSSDGTKNTSYAVYIVTKPMAKNSSTEATVYGGYLHFDKEADAQAALDSVKNLSGFPLWNTFSVLSSTTGEGDDAETNTATVETDIKASDITDTPLKTWLFDSARKSGDVALINGGTGYYVAYFFSGDEEWYRAGKDQWVANQFEEDLLQRIEDKNYHFNEEMLDKLGDPTEHETDNSTTVTTTTTAA